MNAETNKNFHAANQTQVQVPDLMTRIQNRGNLTTSVEKLELIRQAAVQLPSYFGVEGEEGYAYGNIEASVAMLELTLTLIADFAVPFASVNGRLTGSEAMIHACSHLMGAAMTALAILTQDPGRFGGINAQQMGRLVAIYHGFFAHEKFLTLCLFASEIAINREGSILDPSDDSVWKAAARCLWLFESLLIKALYKRLREQARINLPAPLDQSSAIFAQLENENIPMAEAFAFGIDFSNEICIFRISRANKLAKSISDDDSCGSTVHFAYFFDAFGAHFVYKKAKLGIVEALWGEATFGCSKYQESSRVIGCYVKTGLVIGGLIALIVIIAVKQHNS